VEPPSSASSHQVNVARSSADDAVRSDMSSSSRQSGQQQQHTMQQLQTEQDAASSPIA